MRVRYTVRAQANLDAILRYVAADNPKAAADLVVKFQVLIEQLSRYPNLGRPTNPPGRRILTVPNAPYRIYYRLAEDEIRILTIRHSSRRPLRTPG